MACIYLLMLNKNVQRMNNSAAIQVFTTTWHEMVVFTKKGEKKMLKKEIFVCGHHHNRVWLNYLLLVSFIFRNVFVFC